MPYSSLKKTRWSFDSDRDGPAERQASAQAGLIELSDVSLRFVSYSDKQYSLKRAVLDMLLRRESQAPSSEFWALSNITLKIAAGDRVGVVGGEWRRQEHVAAAPGEDLPADRRASDDPRQRRTVDRDGRGVQPRALRP
ncbi:MAG: hypothetical protein ACHRXM_14255 [Isosphaerales bacterium]